MTSFSGKPFLNNIFLLFISIPSKLLLELLTLLKVIKHLTSVSSLSGSVNKSFTEFSSICICLEIESIGIVAVNLYVLISSYFLCEKEFGNISFLLYICTVK